jgi:hypothetical protein
MIIQKLGKKIGDIMFGKINSWADSSRILHEARKNVREISALKEVLLFVISYLLIFGLISLFFIILYENLNLSYTELDLLYLFSMGFEIIIIFLFVNKIEKRSLRSIGISKENAIPSILKGSAIGFAMFLAVVGIGVLLGQYSYNGLDMSMLFLAIPYLLGFFVQSLAEEIETRGWVNTYFSKRHRVFIGFLISDLIFVLTHASNTGLDIVSIINIFTIGVLFTMLFWKYDNIWVCGSAHAMWNFAQGYLLGFNVSGIKSTSLFSFQQNSQSIIGGGIFGPESGLIATFVAIIAIVIVWYYPKKSNV